MTRRDLNSRSERRPPFRCALFGLYGGNQTVTPLIGASKIPMIGVEMGACVSKSLCPPTAHHASYTWSPCASRVHGGRPNFRRISEPHIPELRKKKDGQMKDIDAGDGVSIKTPAGRQPETTSLLFPRPLIHRTLKSRTCLMAEH